MTPSRRRVAVTVAFLAALASCDAERHQVDVVLGAGPDGLHGFTCREDDTDRPLFLRVVESGTASMVFDFVDLGGVPGCRSTQLVDWCRTHECRTVERRCIDIPPPASLAELPQAVLDAIDGVALTGDAPDGPVLLRAVATAAACDDVPALDPVPRATLVGCAYSCPVVLDQVEDPVLLDLDVFGDRCQQAVEVCASLFDTPAAAAATLTPSGCDGG